MDFIVSFPAPNSNIEALTSNVAVFGDRALKVIIILNDVIRLAL